MKIKYVGVKKDGETAFSRETKIEAWLPGDSHEINDPVLAKKMLQHPDVFAVDEGETAPVPTPAQTPAPTPAPTEAPAAGLTLAPGAKVEPTADPLANIDSMEAPELHALAKSLGVKVHPNSGATKVREALRAQ